MHKIITYIFTGKKINFGNYSLITRKDVEKIYSKASLWSSFSGTIKKNLKPLNEIKSIRGIRYFGPSQMSLSKLLLHSFSIIAVFKFQVLFRSTLMIIILATLNPYLGILTIVVQIFLIIFNFTIFIVSKREVERDLIKSHENLKNLNNITQ